MLLMNYCCTHCVVNECTCSERAARGWHEVLINYCLRVTESNSVVQQIMCSGTCSTERTGCPHLLLLLDHVCDVTLLRTTCLQQAECVDHTGLCCAMTSASLSCFELVPKDSVHACVVHLRQTYMSSATAINVRCRWVSYVDVALQAPQTPSRQVLGVTHVSSFWPIV